MSIKPPGRSNRYYERWAEATRLFGKHRKSGQKPANEALRLQSRDCINVALPIEHCVQRSNTVHLRNFFFKGPVRPLYGRAATGYKWDVAQTNPVL